VATAKLRKVICFDAVQAPTIIAVNREIGPRL